MFLDKYTKFNATEVFQLREVIHSKQLPFIILPSGHTQVYNMLNNISKPDKKLITSRQIKK